MLRTFLPRSCILGVFVLLIAGSMVIAAAPARGLEPLAAPNAWSDLHPTGSPSPRYGAAMAYDSLRNRVVLFGGENDRGKWLNDTWTYDVSANTWTDGTPVASPPAMNFPRIVYDSAARHVLLFGLCPGSCAPTGSPAQVWSYDPDASNWALRWAGPGGIGAGAVATREFSAAYDPESDQTVLFGGGDWAPHYPGLGTNETWLYDDSSKAWTNANPVGSPPRRFGSAMTYHSASGHIVLFGGCSVPANDFTCTAANDLWSYDGHSGTWAEMSAATRPPSLEAMVYDSLADRLILFGHNETWAYDPGAATWTNRSPATNPPARSFPAMVYASGAGHTILFGGETTGSVFADTWAYQYGAATSTSPPPMEASTAALLVGVPIAAVLVVGALVWLRRSSKLRGRGPQ